MGPPRMESDTAAKRRGSRRDGAEGRAGIEVRPLISELTGDDSCYSDARFRSSISAPILRWCATMRKRRRALEVDVLVANAGGGRGRPMDTKASTFDPAHLQL